MKWVLPYMRLGLWGGAILVALDAALVVAIHACNYCGQSCSGCVFALTRVSFLAHPIQDRVFNSLVLAFLDGEKRDLHTWQPTTMEVIRDMILFHGLGFLEAFFYGILLGTLAKIAYPRLIGT